MEMEKMEEEIKMEGMKAKWIGESILRQLTHGKIYEVLSIEDDLYRIVDDDEDGDYLYPAEGFEVIEKGHEV